MNKQSTQSESGPEQGLEHRAEECSRSGDVLSVEKRLGHVSRKHKSALTRASGCAYLGCASHRGIHMQDSIARVHFIKRSFGSR